MKKNVYLMLLMSLLSCTLFAQTVDREIRLRERATPLKTVIRKIERQSTYLFLYNETRIDMEQPIHLHIATSDIRQLLDRLCEVAPIRYEIMDEQILLLPHSNGEAENTQRLISGYIQDEQGHPLEFVSIYDKVTEQGILTDETGHFRLMVNDSSRLQISHVAYQPLEITVDPTQQELHLQLTPAVFKLDEVVAIGYGTLARRELTSAVGYITADQFLTGKHNNPIQAIKGQIAGLSLSGASPADINAEPDLQIRGIGSILAGNKPLIVVDGVPGISLNSLSQTEIASISVLKDGTSAAIYGSNGANGVILITTKQAKGNDPLQATYQSYVAASKEYNRPKILSSKAYVDKGRGTDFGYQTDWYDALLRPLAWEHNHDLSLQNGWQSGSFRASANYRNGDGLDIVSTRKEYALRTHINQQLLANLLELNLSLSYKRQTARLGNHMAFRHALQLNPTAPIYLDESRGDYYFPTGFEHDNAVSTLKEEIKEQETQYQTATFDTRLNWSSQCYTSLMLSENRETAELGTYWTSHAKESVDNSRRGRALRSNQRQINRLLDLTTHYTHEWNSHSLKAMVGYSWQHWEETTIEAGNANFASDDFTWNNLGAGTFLAEGKATMGSSKSTSRLISLFTRLNYSYRDLLMLAASYRREGSSKFGSNHKWGNFPALSGGIRLTSLSPFQAPWLNDLKLKFGYGISGRQHFSPYQSLSTYNNAGYFMLDGKWVKVYGPDNTPNPDLRWEKSIHTNLGVEASLMDNRFNLSLNLYRRATKDLIFVYNAIKPPMIHDYVTTNVGSILARGIELELNWHTPTTTPLQYQVSLAGSWQKSILQSLSNERFKLGYTYLYDLPAPGLPGPAIRLEEEKPIGSFFGWRYAGTDSEGNILVWNKEGVRIPTAERKEEDKAFIGNGVPKVQASMSHQLHWKSFDLRFVFTSWLGYDLLNLKQMYYGLQNVPVANLLEDAYTRNNHIKGDKIYCDYFIESGDFLKLEELTLGYRLPLRSNRWIKSLRLYLSADNLFTITSYSGSDPANVNVNGVTPGIEATEIYPAARTYTIGLTVQF